MPCFFTTAGVVDSASGLNLKLSQDTTYYVQASGFNHCVSCLVGVLVTPISGCKHHHYTSILLFVARFPKVSASDKGTETDMNKNQQLCYHVLGQPQSQDVVVLADPEHPVSTCGLSQQDRTTWGALASAHPAEPGCTCG